jgi:quercetin dioxygenase-like cupin family protein
VGIPAQPPTARGPAEWFTGAVFLDAVGQTLYVTDGRGFVQARGGEVTALRAGDVVHAPADEWHWHGAAPEHYMTHLSITEAPGDDRPETVWGEHVTEAEYPS